MSKSNSESAVVASGSLLVADFQTALVSMATAATAKAEAKRSEDNAVSAIASAPISSNPIFVTPRDIPEAIQADLTRTSVDAHMKKVQAEQISNFSQSQIAQLEQDARKKYLGKKMTITVQDAAAKPVEAVWFNDKTGQQNQTIIKKKVIKGIVEEIQLSKNYLLLRPTLVSRLFVPARKLYIVYVINPQNLAPAVQISI